METIGGGGNKMGLAIKKEKTIASFRTTGEKDERNNNISTPIPHGSLVLRIRPIFE